MNIVLRIESEIKPTQDVHANCGMHAHVIMATKLIDDVPVLIKLLVYFKMN